MVFLSLESFLTWKYKPSRQTLQVPKSSSLSSRTSIVYYVRSFHQALYVFNAFLSILRHFFLCDHEFEYLIVIYHLAYLINLSSTVVNLLLNLYF